VEGVLVRTVIPEAPIGVEYRLTDKGRALEAAVVAISKWAEKWVPGPAAAKRSGTRRR
jgi:DNA-binding HxlR family transcriptional regulator